MIRLWALLLAGVCFAGATEAPEQAIRGVMDRQVAAWNRGDLDVFASSYLNSPRVLFVGRDFTRGYAQMLEHYRKGYPTREKMGQLQFSEVEVQLLDPQYANVVGRFHLHRTKEGGGDASGVFTLLFQNTPQGWKIIQDHTS